MSIDNGERVSHSIEGLAAQPYNDPAARTQTRRSRLFKTVALLALGTLLVWLVVTRSLVANLSETAPEAALRLRAGDATALVKLAEQYLLEQQAGQSDPQAGRDRTAGSKPTLSTGAFTEPRAQVRASVERALRDAPLNARALRILGQLNAEDTNEVKIMGLMNAAARLSLRESIALFWLMQKSYEQGDTDATLNWADALLRTRPRLAQYVVPMLAQIAENESTRGLLEALLAKNPPWRGQFFSLLPKAMSDARTPLFLLLSLKETATPPTANDLRGYLKFLIARKFHQLAYYTWLHFLPPEQLANAGLLFNGSFEIEPAGLPFDWTMKSGSGVTIDIAVRHDSDDERALFIAFLHGRVEFGGVSQMTMLPPGTYQLKGRYQGRIIGRRGLKWHITCAGAKAPLGESSMFVGVARQWREFMVTFSVPAADCRAQYLRLTLDARSASERLVTGSVWYDELVITRVNPSG